jgi:hypothetical protein
VEPATSEIGNGGVDGEPHGFVHETHLPATVSTTRPCREHLERFEGRVIVEVQRARHDRESGRASTYTAMASTKRRSSVEV